MAFGLFLSAVCSTESAALQGAIAIYLPSVLLSGKFIEVYAAHNVVKGPAS